MKNKEGKLIDLRRIQIDEKICMTRLKYLVKNKKQIKRLKVVNKEGRILDMRK